MTSTGFNPTQVKQLSGMFEHVVDSLGQTIAESESRTNQKITNLELELKHELKTEISRVREDIQNLAAITPTKQQVQRLEKAVFGNTS
jgi:hypothetical protein